MTLILEMILTTALSVLIVCAGVALWDWLQACREDNDRTTPAEQPLTEAGGSDPAR